MQQHPLFSYILAPIIYSLIKILCDNTELYHNSDVIPDRFRATYYDKEDTFDFIVVGAGSAGAIVANRLVKNDFRVLLLEAGGEMMPAQYIPSTSLLLLDKPELDWQHYTVPQTKSCGALRNRRSLWSAGKGLGGSSLLNFLQYIRGHPKDYDNWANITGDPSWSYDQLVSHFKEFENFQEEFESYDSHGHSGEVIIKPPPFPGMRDYFVAAAVEKGIPHRDLNGPHEEGADIIYNNIRNGRRLSTYNAFLEPIRNNPLLTIYKFSEVTKVLLGVENKAYGVEYRRHGVMKNAYANKEVVLSAGLVNSAKILMLSGIGPSNHLRELGIEVKYDQPSVGKNIQDHPAVYLGPFIIDKPISMLLDRDVNSETMTEFMNQGTGPLSSAGTLATAVISSKYAKEAGHPDWPDIQWIFLGTGIYSKYAEDFAHGFNVVPQLLKKYLRNSAGLDSFQIIVSANRPYQRGELYLKSKDPFDDVIIDPKYFHDDRDLEVLVEGIKRAVDLVENTTVFQTVNARFVKDIFPGCEGPEFRSDDYWRCLSTQYTITMHHLVGSCSMGHPNSSAAVVDPQLRVIGVKNLRVIDASVMPVVPNVNTNAASMVIGQKGSYEIIRDWKTDDINAVINNV